MDERSVCSSLLQRMEEVHSSGCHRRSTGLKSLFSFFLSYNTLLLRLLAISPARQTMQNVLEVQRVLREEIWNGEDDVYNCNEACVLKGERVRGAWSHVGGGSSSTRFEIIRAGHRRKRPVNPTHRTGSHAPRRWYLELQEVKRRCG